MTSFAAQIKTLSSLKPLADQIIDIVAAAIAPIGVGEIFDQLKDAPDRETVSREIFSLKKAGRIENVGTTKQPGFPANTYRLANGQTVEADDKGKPSTETAAKNDTESQLRGRILRELKRRAGKPVAAYEICQSIGTPTGVVAAELELLFLEGQVLQKTDPDKRKAPKWSVRSTDAIPVAAGPFGYRDECTAPIPLAAPKAPEKAPDADIPAIEFGVFSNGVVSISDDDQLIELTRDDAMALCRFLDSCRGVIFLESQQ